VLPQFALEGYLTDGFEAPWVVEVKDSSSPAASTAQLTLPLVGVELLQTFAFKPLCHACIALARNNCFFFRFFGDVILSAC
jgi:hypothetical protein